MIYKSKVGDIDLSKVLMLYPAGIVEAHGEVAEMSLEWCEMNENKVKIKEYILVFDFTQPKDEVKNKTILKFRTKNELIKTMTEVAQFFQD